jgi:caffeoyl-CoA O-methyltransferase
MATMDNEPKTPGLDASVYAYMLENSTPPDTVLSELAAETERLFPRSAGMRVPPEQGAFLTMLVRLSGARFAVELGTFTGYSALCLARGLPPEGRLLTVDVDDQATAVGEFFWEKAGLSEKVELRLGDAAEVLRSLPEEQTVDLAFVDADKEGYPAYHEELLKRLSPDGLILYDNTLAEGGVLEVEPEDWVRDIKRFNELLAADGRVEKVLLPIGDGLTLAQRKRLG